ncbi:MAG: glutathione S-transferase family protein [Methylacidiphilales bacterium]|nr:glutathione S-transferase family protein [Candidatus Methylacidiphilales bacterium]
MITLYGFGAAFGQPDPSPFVLKTELLLKFAGLPYRIDTSGMMRAPKGKLPYIDDDGTLVPDSTFIRFHIEKKYSFDFDSGLDAKERAIAWAVEKMIEDQLYWALVHDRWMDDNNFTVGPKTFFKRIPPPLRQLAIVLIRRKIRDAMKGQGFGRHSRAEVAELTGRVVDSVAAILGDRPFLMGNAPCGADATVAGMLIAILCPIFDSPTRTAIERHANLVAYRDRMMERYFPPGG